MSGGVSGEPACSFFKEGGGVLAGKSFCSLAGTALGSLFELFWLLLTFKYTKDNAWLLFRHRGVCFRGVYCVWKLCVAATPRQLVVYST